MTGSREPKAITIRVVLDVCGALVDESFVGNLRLFDNNRGEGSTGLGTNALATAVRPGDTVYWLPAPIESEANFEVASITFPDGSLTAKRSWYEGTGVHRWQVTINEAITEAPYEMTFVLGSGLTRTNGPSTRLIGAVNVVSSANDESGVNR